MVDAEQTYLQPAIDHCVQWLQQRYNKQRPVVYNTIQSYLTDSKYVACLQAAPLWCCRRVIGVRPSDAQV
jgi:hypothetical protein